MPLMDCGLAYAVRSMQEAMPYEQLDKLVNEELLNQYIESRCALKMATWKPE